MKHASFLQGPRAEFYGNGVIPYKDVDTVR